MALNEIIMESILRLQKIGDSNNGTDWHFFVRSSYFMTRFFYNADKRRVDFDIDIMENNEMYSHINDKRRIPETNYFYIYELDEKQRGEHVGTAILVTTQCNERRDCRSYYLYDPLAASEFKHFMALCYAFGKVPSISREAIVKRYDVFGGLLGNLLDLSKQDHAWNASLEDTLNVVNKALSTANRDSAKNIIGVKFDYSYPYKGDIDTHCQALHTHGLKAFYVSDYMAIKLSKWVKRNYFIPEVINTVMNKVISVYSGALRNRQPLHELPPEYLIENWIMKIADDSAEAAVGKLRPISRQERNKLIQILPSTNKIKEIDNKLILPFSQLSTEYVYRCNAKYNYPFHHITADPLNKRIFMFRCTDDYKYQSLHIISAMRALQLDPDSIDEIHYFLLLPDNNSARAEDKFVLSLIDQVDFPVGALKLLNSRTERFILDTIFFKSDKQDEVILSEEDIKKATPEETKLINMICRRIKQRSLTVEEVKARIQRVSDVLKGPSSESDKEYKDYEALQKKFGTTIFSDIYSKLEENKYPESQPEFKGKEEELLSQLKITHYDYFDTFYLRGNFTFRRPLGPDNYDRLAEFLKYARKLKVYVCRNKIYNITEAEEED